MPLKLSLPTSVRFHRAGIKNEDRCKEDANLTSKTFLLGGRVEIVTKRRLPVILRPKFLKNQQQSSAPPTQPREKVRLSTNTTQSKSPISRAVLSTYGNWVERLRLLQAHLAEQMAGDTALTIAQQYHAVTDELQRAINSPPQNSDELATQIAGGAKRLQALRLDLSLSWDQKANLSARMRRVQAHAS